MKKNSLLNYSLLAISFTFIGKITGFFREISLTYFYGASKITDAYITVGNINVVVFTGVLLAASMAFIPISKTIEKEDIDMVVSNFINVIALISICLSFVIMIFAEKFLKIFAIGFDAYTAEIAIIMLRMSLPLYFTYGISTVIVSFLNTKGNFWLSGVSVVLVNFTLISSVIFSKGNIVILGIGISVSLVVQFILSIIVLRKSGFCYYRIVNLKDKYLIDIFKMSIPMLMGNIVLQLNTIVDRNFASTLGTGIVSSMQYANKLSTFFLTLFVISIATAIFPTLSQQANDDISALKKTAARANNVILVVAIPVTVIILLLGNSIVELAFMRGAFDQTSADITANVLRLYALGLPALSLAEVLNREFYALKDTRTPIFCSAISIITNLSLDFILVKPFGYMGLAIATSIASVILVVLLFKKLQKKIGEIGLKSLWDNFVKMSLAASVMGVVVYFVSEYIMNLLPQVAILNRIIMLSTASSIGAMVYTLIIYFLRVDEVCRIIGLIKDKVFTRK